VGALTGGTNAASPRRRSPFEDLSAPTAVSPLRNVPCPLPLEVCNSSGYVSDLSSFKDLVVSRSCRANRSLINRSQFDPEHCPFHFKLLIHVKLIIELYSTRYNRARVLAVCTLVFVVAILLMGTVKEYWHLVVLRMIMAAGESGCNPLATGILTDLFPEHQRALVLSIFNWGIYGGYGIAFPVGRYIPTLNAWGLVSTDMKRKVISIRHRYFLGLILRISNKYGSDKYRYDTH
jgi:hypothetical protein